MESLLGPDFETEGFKEIFEYRDRFLYFVHEIFRLAVGAVKKVLQRDAAHPGVNLDVGSHLPTKPFPNQEELLPAPNQLSTVRTLLLFLNCPLTQSIFTLFQDVIISKPVLKSPESVIPQISVAKVIFNEAYKGESLLKQYKYLFFK